jgi:quercetin dioxygenase-like cupin family protein
VTERELLEALRRERLTPDGSGVPVSRWSNGPGDRYEAHRHDYDKVLRVDSGSIEFALPELERSLELRAGDRLDLPYGTLHAATVGSDGVACVEAHLPAGTLRSETATARRA